MKKVAVAILSLVLVFALSGCSMLYDHQNNAMDGFSIGYSKTLGDAFLGAYYWDGTEEGMHITIPEYYDNMKITSLGGFFGRGVPTAFYIKIPADAKNGLCPDATWYYDSQLGTFEASEVVYLPFFVHISQYIQKIEGCSAGGILVAEHIDGEETKYTVYVYTCYVTCDEENPVFYAKDGKLYDRATDTMVDDFLYSDYVFEARQE